MKRIHHIFIDDFEFSILDDYSMIVTPMSGRIWDVNKPHVLGFIDDLGDLLHSKHIGSIEIEDSLDRVRSVYSNTNGTFTFDKRLMSRYSLTKLLLFLEDSYNYKETNE